ncbi:RNA recognition motif domain [Dillenia turbinata]|uniref:RNA recognition motif domain n=1 Tax=Dillenia turbinata TaxID=194707 RepID=A0AAN8Z1M3_9MAGN
MQTKMATLAATAIPPVQLYAKPLSLQSISIRLPNNISLFSSSASRCHHRLPSLIHPSFVAATQIVHQIRRPDCLVFACLPSSSSSSPDFTTSKPQTKLYVSGLSFRTTEESLRNAFKDFGQLVELNLVMDKIANRPRGFAFLRYATEEESKKAIEGMHGKFLDGRVIFVEVAKSRSELRKSFKQSPRNY